MNRKQFLLAWVVLLSAKGIAAIPAANHDDRVDVTLNVSFDAKDKVHETVQALDIQPSSKIEEVSQQITEVLKPTFVPETDDDDDDNDTSGMSSEELKEVHCLNDCSNAVFLFSSGGDLCNSKDSSSFYNAAQKCSKCMCEFWSGVEDKDTLFKGFQQCSIPKPTCKPEEYSAKPMEKRAERLVARACKRRQTITRNRARQHPALNSKCAPGYNARVIKIPQQRLAASRRVGNNCVVTFFPQMNFPALNKNLPACSNRRTVTVRPNRPQVKVTPTCNPGFNKRVVRVNGHVFQASRWTKNDVVTFRQYASFPPLSVTIPACKNRKTVQVTPKRPGLKQTCAPGTKAVQTRIAAVKYAQRVVTGKDDVVTVHKAVSYPAISTKLPPCNKNPVKKPASKKPPAKKPASKKPAQKKPAQKKPAQKKPAQKKPAQKKPAQKKPAQKKPAKKRPTVTVVPKRNIKQTCAPGTASKTVVFAAKTFTRKVVSGKNGVITIHQAKTYPAVRRKLPPCKGRSPTKKPAKKVSAKPTAKSPAKGPGRVRNGKKTIRVKRKRPIPSCVQGSQKKTTWIPPRTLARKVVTGKDNVVTIKVPVKFNGYTATLIPCNKRKTVTITPGPPKPKKTCTPGNASGYVQVPAKTYKASTWVRKNVATVRIAKSFPQTSKLVPPCANGASPDIPEDEYYDPNEPPYEEDSEFPSEDIPEEYFPDDEYVDEDYPIEDVPYEGEVDEGEYYDDGEFIDDEENYEDFESYSDEPWSDEPYTGTDQYDEYYTGEDDMEYDYETDGWDEDWENYTGSDEDYYYTGSDEDYYYTGDDEDYYTGGDEDYYDDEEPATASSDQNGSYVAASTTESSNESVSPTPSTSEEQIQPMAFKMLLDTPEDESNKKEKENKSDQSKVEVAAVPIESSSAPVRVSAAQVEQNSQPANAASSASNSLASSSDGGAIVFAKVPSDAPAATLPSVIAAVPNEAPAVSLPAGVPSDAPAVSLQIPPSSLEASSSSFSSETSAAQSESSSAVDGAVPSDAPAAVPNEAPAVSLPAGVPSDAPAVSLPAGVPNDAPAVSLPAGVPSDAPAVSLQSSPSSSETSSSSSSSESSAAQSENSSAVDGAVPSDSPAASLPAGVPSDAPAVSLPAGVPSDAPAVSLQSSPSSSEASSSSSSVESSAAQSESSSVVDGAVPSDAPAASN